MILPEDMWRSAVYDICQCSGGKCKIEWSRRYLRNVVGVQFWTYLLTKFPHEMVWDWSWTFLVTVQRLTTWTMLRSKCEVLIRKGVRIRARNLRNTVCYINILNLKYLLFLQNCAFIYCHPFILVIRAKLIKSSGQNFMTTFSFFKLRGYGHSQICLKPICATGTSYLPTISSDWML